MPGLPGTARHRRVANANDATPNCRRRADRVVQDPPPHDETLRDGLNSMVRSRRSSNRGNVAGPFTKSTMWRACSALRPGSTSTSTILRTRSGAVSVRAIVVMPPYDIPTTPAPLLPEPGWQRRRRRPRPSAIGQSVAARRARPNVRDREGRSQPVTSGAAPSQPCPRCARCEPPCSSTNSGSPSPQTSVPSRRPGSTSTCSWRTAGGPSYGRPYSFAFRMEQTELVVLRPLRRRPSRSPLHPHRPSSRRKLSKLLRQPESRPV